MAVARCCSRAYRKGTWRCCGSAPSDRAPSSGGGNPDAHERADPSTGRLSPRKSFEAWTEHVSGRSDPWSDIDLAVAGEIGMAIAAELAQRAKAELARLRHYDPLTGLPNRSLFNERLAQVDTGVDGPVALLFFDLDRFKAVNDTLGHAAGDALLIQVARRLMSAIGPDHLAARLGGDEFVVLCRGCDAKGAAALGERIRVAVEAPFEILGQPCRIAASIGVATSGPMGGIDLVKAADIAMYAAKKGGGNRVIVSDPSLYASAAWHLEFDQDLRESLGRDDQFVLFYQPVFSIAGASRTLIGFESLLRWNHPKQGWMEPHQLIPHAERSGLLPDLGRWVIEHALRRGHILRRHGPALWISVNVSGCELASAGFCEALDARLRAASYPPIALCLEVTQSAPNDPALSAVLGDVRRLGVRVAIDEFGIGYSSLSYLRRLPVDVVKLDRSLLQHVDGDARATTFVGAVVALAHAAGMAVTAEGIETQAELDFAVAAGIGAAQGFLFEKPLSGAAAELFAANWSDAAKPRPARA